MALSLKEIKTLGKAVGEVTGNKIAMVGVKTDDIKDAILTALSSMDIKKLPEDVQPLANTLIASEGPTDPEDVSHEDLIAAAEDLNAILGLKPELDTEVDAEELQTAIIELCSDEEVAPRASDGLQQETFTVLRKLGVGPTLPDVKDDKKKDSKDDKKKDDKKTGPKQTKASTKTEKPKKEPSGPKYTRAAAVVDAVRFGKSENIGDLIKEADDYYAKSGGTSNPREAKFASTYVLGTLVAAGIMIVSGHGDDATFEVKEDLFGTRPSTYPSLK